MLLLPMNCRLVLQGTVEDLEFLGCSAEEGLGGGFRVPGYTKEGQPKKNMCQIEEQPA